MSGEEILKELERLRKENRSLRQQKKDRERRDREARTATARQVEHRRALRGEGAYASPIQQVGAGIIRRTIRGETITETFDQSSRQSLEEAFRSLNLRTLEEFI